MRFRRHRWCEARDGRRYEGELLATCRFDNTCLTPVQPLSPKKIKALRRSGVHRGRKVISLLDNVAINVFLGTLPLLLTLPWGLFQSDRRLTRIENKIESMDSKINDMNGAGRN